MLSDHASSIFVVAALAAALWVLMRRFLIADGSSRDAASPSRPIPRLVGQPRSVGFEAPLPPNLLSWQVELEETGRELKAELDGKFAALQALVATAQREALRLETAIGRIEAMRHADLRDSLATIEELAEADTLNNPAALSQAVAQVVPLPATFDRHVFAADCKSLQVARLCDQGQSAAEIAHRLQLPLGEVELLLSLRSV
jgi:hypothetical protein